MTTVKETAPRYVRTMWQSFSNKINLSKLGHKARRKGVIQNDR